MIEPNQTWQNRADVAIAHGALTNSKRPECLVNGVYPTHLESGLGCFVRDIAGNTYIDFICGLGTNLLGYGHAEITQAIARQASRGANLPLGTPLEVLTAEKIKELFPFVDRVRFLKTGSEACSAAVRIARATTGRMKVLSEGYHGWHDMFVSLTPPAIGAGIREQYHIDQLIWNTPTQSDLAAVIVEPVITELSENRTKQLRSLRDVCSSTGAMLIFDEVITGFRTPQYSMARHLDIEPDLICLGKAIANGMPLSVVAGKKEVMECDQYFVSSTYAGETLSLAAGLKTMELLQKKYDVSFLWEKGRVFQESFNKAAKDVVRLIGYPTRGIIQGAELSRALFFQECCRAGILFGPSLFLNFSHVDVLDQVISTVQDVCTRIRTGSVSLLGGMPQTPFSQRVRNL